METEGRPDGHNDQQEGKQKDAMTNKKGDKEEDKRKQKGESIDTLDIFLEINF